MRLKAFLLFTFSFLTFATIQSQDGYGNQWIFGKNASSTPSGIMLNFNNDTLTLESVDKQMELEGSCAIVSDSVGKLLFYSNGCYIADANHQIMVNGDSIGKGTLETSFCHTGGNPLMQAMIALPKPGSDHLYYLFYTDIGDPYFMQPFFPLAPVTLYYSVIDMALENGLGKVVEKNTILLQDTFSRGMIQAAKHANGKDWWVVQPKSHSNCYWTFLLTENGIDTVFNQCIGQVWGDDDPQGQAVFSPDLTSYARANYFYGLNIFDFNNATGLFSNQHQSSLDQDTFYYGGLAFSPNSRFVYATCYKKIWQFDTQSADISESRILIGELITPDTIPYKTHFVQSRLGPDGKIYVAGRGSSRHLHVINRPNCYGMECSLQQYAIPFNITSGNTMPNMPHYKYWSNSDTCETVGTVLPHNITKNKIKLYPNPANQYVVAEGLVAGDEIEWTDLSGRVLKKVTYQINQLNIVDLTPGFYLLKVYREGVFFDVLKIVKE